MADDNYQCNSLLASALKVEERSKENTFLSNESCWRLSFDSYGKFMSRGIFLRTTTRQTVCFHLPLSLLNETAKGQSFRLKVDEDPNVSFDRYRILESWWTWLPKISSVTVFLHLLSRLKNEAKELLFCQTKVVGDSLSIATENSVPGNLLADNY